MLHSTFAIAKHRARLSDLIVDFPAQIRRHVISSRPKKKMVHFSNECDIRFYERPDELFANELHYSREDIKGFKLANRQVVQDVHTRHLSLVNGAIVDAREVFQGCELTGLEHLLTPGLVKKSMALKRGLWDAVLDEQDRQYASGSLGYDPDGLALAAKEYSR